MSFISIFLKAVESILFDAISEAQKEYRRDHCLNKYNDNDWRDDIFWR